MARTSILLEKSISACISAIEIYNKPDFKYREETFSILIINAWELLLKAKILKDNKNKLDSIYIKEARILADGSKSQKHTKVKTSRSGNPMSIELLRALDIVAKTTSDINVAFKENIIAICEIRDNAIHFKNEEVQIGKIVLELGTASLKNYLNAVKRWFGKDLSKYNFYLMPISFFHDFESVESFSLSKSNLQLKRLLNYLGNKTSTIKSNPDQDYNLLLTVETRFVKSTVEDALVVKTVKKKSEAENPDLVHEVVLKEEDITQKYPWTYKDLCRRLKNRYKNFKQDLRFNGLIKGLKQDANLCHVRALFPSNPKSIKTFFYSPNCIPNYFDKHYQIV